MLPPIWKCSQLFDNAASYLPNGNAAGYLAILPTITLGPATNNYSNLVIPRFLHGFGWSTHVLP